MSFTKGQRVYGRWLMPSGRYKLYKGTITCVSARGSFCDIIYDDGDVQQHKHVREIFASRETSRAAAPHVKYDPPCRMYVPCAKKPPCAKKAPCAKKTPCVKKAQSTRVQNSVDKLLPLYFKRYLIKRFKFINDRIVLLEFYENPPVYVRMK